MHKPERGQRTSSNAREEVERAETDRGGKIFREDGCALLAPTGKGDTRGGGGLRESANGRSEGWPR
jgi:hypothetical protein